MLPVLYATEEDIVSTQNIKNNYLHTKKNRSLSGDFLFFSYIHAKFVVKNLYAYKNKDASPKQKEHFRCSLMDSFKIVYKEIIDGSRYSTEESIGDVYHRVVQRLATTTRHVRFYGNRTRSRSHKLLHVDVKESV